MFDDLLGSMFGGGGAGGAGGAGTGFRAPRGPRRGEDLSASVNLTFRQAVEGSQLSLRVDDPQAGVRTINARVPAGVRDGQKVRLRGKGRPGDLGGEDGDLVVTVHVEPDSVFAVDGTDLRITVPVTFPEAALGAQVDVPTFEGGTVRVRIPAGTPSGRTLRVKGHGVHTAKRTGDLLVTVQVAVPQRVDAAAREALEAYAAHTGGDDPRADLMARVHKAAGAGDGH
jgi:molecular chaperone DnaJ